MKLLNLLWFDREWSLPKVIVGAMAVIFALVAIFGWFLGIEEMTSILPGSATMKLNTALLFLFTAINLMIYALKERFFQVLFLVLNTLVLFIAVLTLFQYVFSLDFGIDNLILTDTFSKNLPGRMSPATAIGFFLVALAFFTIKNQNRALAIVGEVLVVLVTLISLVSVVTYLLDIPTENRVFFLQSMAINTSLLFLGISFVMQLDLPYGQLRNMLLGEMEGSKMFVKLMPFMLLLPFVLGYIIIKGVEKEWFSTMFGISLFTVFLMVSGIFYVFFLSKGLNRTDLKRGKLEHSLKKYNQDLMQYKHALDQVAIVAITNRQGVITYVNDKFCEISEYLKEELIGQTHGLINAGYHPKEFFDDLWKTIASGKIWVGDVKNKTKNGEFYWVSTAIIPFMEDDGKIYQYMAIRQDITQQKLAEELLHSDYVKKLEYKNKELEQFVYITSHDLQEPLRSIKSFSGLLMEECASDLDGTAKKGLEFMSKSANRMSLMIKDLLDYSRLGKNRDLTIVDCKILLKEVEEDLKGAMDDNGAKLILENLQKVRGYETELRLLFQNLISNAIKFQKPGTKPEIVVGGEEEDGQWLFWVKDNGIGIKEEHQDRVFTIFKRLHGKDEYDGSGIGLAHCQKIVEMHGGKIWVESEPGKGSQFYFTIKH